MADEEGIGRAGEFFAAYRLEMSGVRVSHVDVSGHDLWCRTPSGRLLSVQVKTTSRAVLDPRGRMNYTFCRRMKVAYPRTDLFGFVALDIGLVIFEEEMGSRRRIAVTDMTERAMRESVVRFFY